MCDRAVVPACEDAAAIGSEGYDVAEDLERGERFVNYGFMTLTDAFYSCCEAAESYNGE